MNDQYGKSGLYFNLHIELNATRLVQGIQLPRLSPILLLKEVAKPANATLYDAIAMTLLNSCVFIIL
jgi:hypothetical protein